MYVVPNGEGVTAVTPSPTRTAPDPSTRSMGAAAVGDRDTMGAPNSEGRGYASVMAPPYPYPPVTLARSVDRSSLTCGEHGSTG